MNPTRTTEPAWMQPCRDELRRLDPTLLLVFEIRLEINNGDCTAAQVFRYMKEHRLQWTPCDASTVRGWVRRVKAVEKQFRGY